MKIDLENLTVTGEVEQVKDNSDVSPKIVLDVEAEPSKESYDASQVKEFVINEGWETVKEYVKNILDMPSLTYNTWVKPLEIEKVQYNTIYLKGFMEGSEKYIEEKFFLSIRAAIMELFQKDYHIAFAENVI